MIQINGPRAKQKLLNPAQLFKHEKGTYPNNKCIHGVLLLELNIVQDKFEAMCQQVMKP